MKPSLSSPHDVSFCQGLWKQRLRNKFQNERKRKDFIFSPVQQRKLGTKRRKVDSDTPKPASLPMYGLPNYLPDRPSGEDETSIGKHKEWLQDEKRARRKRPDMSQIDKRMTLTFADRRLMVVEKNTTVSEVIEEYPWLESFHQVCK